MAESDLDSRLIVRMEATLNKFEKQLAQGKQKTKAAAQEMERDLSLIGSRGDARRFRGFSQQFSQAMQSVANGQSTVNAFSMQLADMTRFMGPMGIVIGATAGALIPLAANLMGAGKETDTLQARMDALRQKVDAFREANENFTLEGLEAVRKKYGEINDEIVVMLENQRRFEMLNTATGTRNAASAFRDELTGGVTGMIRSDEAQIAKSLGLEFSLGRDATAAQREGTLLVFAIRAGLDELAAATEPEQLAKAAAKLTELLKGTSAESGVFAGKLLEGQASARALMHSIAQVPPVLKDGKVDAEEIADELARGADNAERMLKAVRALGEDERGSQRGVARDVAETRTGQWQEREGWSDGSGVRVDYAMGPARPNAPNKEVVQIIAAAVKAALGDGARVIVTSGREDPGQQHGSNRHRTGNAADVAIYAPDGTQLTANDRRMGDVAREAAKRGAKGIGFGAEYMGGQHMHIDSVAPGPGQGNVWASGAKAIGGELTGLMGGKKPEDVTRMTEAAAAAYDRLRASIDPTVAAEQKLAEAEAAVADAVRRGIITREEGQATLDAYKAHLVATSDEMEAAIRKVTEALEGNEQAARSMVEGFIGDMLNGVSAADAFANALGRIGARWLEMGLDSAQDLGWFGKLGGLLFGGGKKAGLPSFDGGGSTGTGSRSGGMDGKGGFAAMLHPNETVIDHTKPSRGGGSAVSTDVRVYVDQDGNWQAKVERIASAKARAMVPAAVAATGQAMSRSKGFGARP